MSDKDFLEEYGDELSGYVEVEDGLYVGIEDDPDGYLLVEMAYGRSEFTAEAKNKVREIIRNHALIKYAAEHGIRTINHWRRELIGLITDFQDMETKPTRGNRDMVKKAIEYVWKTKMELDTHPDAVIHKFIAKFHDENLPVRRDEAERLAGAFIADMDGIIHEMSYGDYDSARGFVYSL